MILKFAFCDRFLSSVPLWDHFPSSDSIDESPSSPVRTPVWRDVDQAWFTEGLEPSEIADRLDRNKSTITRLCVKGCARKVQGRPPTMSESKVDQGGRAGTSSLPHFLRTSTPLSARGYLGILGPWTPRLLGSIGTFASECRLAPGPRVVSMTHLLQSLLGEGGLLGMAAAPIMEIVSRCLLFLRKGTQDEGDRGGDTSTKVHVVLVLGMSSLISVDFMVRRLDQLVHKAKGRWHVTAAMLKRSCRLKAGLRKIRDALHERNIYFRKLRQKPLLTDEDVKNRMAFARKYKAKSKAWWKRNVHAFIDGKHFKVYLNGKERVRAAQHNTFGAYRTPGQGLCGAYVKPKKTLNHNTGAKGCLIMAGVGKGRMLMWHKVAKGRWNGEAAAQMYTGVLGKVLKKRFPQKRKWIVRPHRLQVWSWPPRQGSSKN